MDVRIEAAPMAAQARVALATIRIVGNVSSQVFSLVQRVASFSRPRRHSIIARGPNTIFEGRLALAAA